MASSPLPSPASLDSCPIIPHHFFHNAHALAPSDDIHLAHLIPDLPRSRLLPDFSPPSPLPFDPSLFTESLDRLTPHQLANLPSHLADRLHAAYDIEDHLDSFPNSLLVFGPNTPLVIILHHIASLLLINSPGQQYSKNILYVARLSIHPIPPPTRSYAWESGGPDLLRFELVLNSNLNPVITYSPIEIALSQALEDRHQLLALLHTRHLAQILESVCLPFQFRPIDPIIWLVDPVEYAHAQLRESTEWGWSEHHVQLKSLKTSGFFPPLALPALSDLHPPLSSSLDPFLSNRSPSPRSLPFIHHDHLHHLSLAPALPRASSNPSSISHPATQRPSSSTVPSDDLPAWLNDLLDRRLPNLLALPDGCFSSELLHSPPHLSSLVSTNPITSSDSVVSASASASAIDLQNSSSPPPPLSSSLASRLVLKPPPFRSHHPSWIHSPPRIGPPPPQAIDSLNNSVPASIDQHHFLASPAPSHPDLAIVRGHRHAQTNTLRYYPCKACAEHAFKLALSHKLDEERRRTLKLITPKHSHQSREKNKSLDLDPSLEACHEEIPLPSSGCQADDWPTSRPPISSNHTFAFQHSRCHRAIGLGSKGKAVKEAMDREDDEYLSRLSSQRHSTRNLDNSHCARIPQLSFPHSNSENRHGVGQTDAHHLSSSNLGICRCDSHHAWDEGESVDD